MKVYLILFEKGESPTDIKANNEMFKVWNDGVNKPKELVGILNASWNSPYSTISTSQYDITVSPTLLFMGVSEELDGHRAKVVEVHRIVGADITSENIKARLSMLSYVKPPSGGENGSVITAFPTPGADPSGGYGGVNPGWCKMFGLPCESLWLIGVAAGLFLGSKSQNRTFQTLFFGGAAYSGYQFYQANKHLKTGVGRLMISRQKKLK